MPELPEVEGARRLVQRTCVGKEIVRAVVADDEKVINDVAPKELEKALVGRTLLAAKRRGKQMWWEMDAGPSLLLHFGMTGGLVVRGVGAAHYKSFSLDDSGAWPPRFCKIELEFDDGLQLAFCDSRRFAKVRWLESPESCPPISQLGWDPLLDWPTLDTFAAQLAQQRRAVKALLLDQSFSAGVGNWVADEVLYQARIHPEQPANSIPQQQVEALHSAIQHVCQLACDVEADADKFPADWLFHYRWGKGSSTKAKVGGHTIEHITVGGRTSAVVPAVQKLNKAAIAAAAAAKAAASSKPGKAAGGKAAGGRRKKAAAAGGGEEGEGRSAANGDGGSDSAAAEAAAAEAAVAVAQAEVEEGEDEGGKPRGRRGKASAAKKAAAVAAEVAEAAAAVTAGGASDGGVEQKAKRGRGRGASGAGAAEAGAGVDATGDGAAAAGRGAKRFRSNSHPQQQGSAAAAAAAAPAAGSTAAKGSTAGGGSSRGGTKAAAAAPPAAASAGRGHKRKAPSLAAASGDAGGSTGDKAGVSQGRGRAGRKAPASKK